jgi:hypothetical protein
MLTDSYRMLVLVREFDDRFGFKKWSFDSCAQWLAWRAGLALSTAREKVRGTAAEARARCDGAAGRGALPADSQRLPGLGAARAAGLGEPLAHGMARREARCATAHRRGADRRGRADPAGTRLRGGGWGGCTEGLGVQICQSRPCSACSATLASSQSLRIRAASRSMSAASSAPCPPPLRRALSRGIEVARFPVVIASAIAKAIT